MIFNVRTVVGIVEQPPLVDKESILNDLAGTIRASARICFRLWMGKLGTEPYGFSSSLRWSMAFWFLGSSSRERL